MRLACGGSALFLALWCAPAHARVGALVLACSADERRAAGELEEALRRALRRLAGPDVVTPQALRRQLAADAELTAARASARASLRRGEAFAQQARYEQSAAAIDAAQRAAERGLAAVAEPRLLAEILARRGMTLLAMGQTAGEAALTASYALWPRPAQAPAGRSPKIIAALRRAAERGRTAGPPRLDELSGARLAERLGLTALLVARVRGAGRAAAIELRLLDALHRRWSAPEIVSWHPERSRARRDRGALRGALRALLGVPTADAAHASRSSRASRRFAAWLATGLAAGLVATSGVLLGLSAQRRADVESQITSPPSVEYFPDVAALDDAGRDLRAAGIATAVAAGVAAATAVTFFLLSRERPRPRARVRSRGAELVLSF